MAPAAGAALRIEGCESEDTGMTWTNIWMVRSASLAACVLSLWLGVPVPGVAGDFQILLGCQHDPDDRILTLVCDRVEREAAGIAAAAGYDVTIIAGKPVLPPAPAPGMRALDIRLTGTRPESQFGTKHVEAILTGSYAPPSAGDWVRELAADGKPRDLVHPVADALLGRLQAFLATSPTE